jgi:hypothetical protein
MSSTSDAYEHAIAKSINESIKGLKAERPKVATSFPDVKVEYQRFTGNNAVWVEVKMNHTDNLMNPRFYYDGGWKVVESYASPATEKITKLWNASKEANQWIEDLKVFLVKNKFKGDVRKMTLHSSVTSRKTDINSVPLDIMKKFLATRPTKNICKVENVDVGELVTLHYLKGKSAVAYYVSSGDDFYQFGTKNPLKIPGVPVFKGMNGIVLRIGDRSGNFEIQAEVKLKTMPHSKYSVKPGTSKENPFRKIPTKL